MKVLTYPTDPNPYQHLLHTALADLDVEARFVPERTRSHTLNLLLLPLEFAVGRARGVQVVHLHWVYPFALPGAHRLPALRHLARAWFGLTLRTIRALGLRLVWTAHNVLPHGTVFPDDRSARARLIGATDAVILHSADVRPQLELLGPGLPALVAEVPHGPFPTQPHSAAARRATRSALGVPAGARLVGMVGRVEAYKGAVELVTAVVAADAPQELQVLVAGECRDVGVRRELEQLSAGRSNVPLQLERLQDSALGPTLAALDAFVVPFQRVTTSGSVLLALGHGVPVVVPAAIGLADLPDDAVHRYEDLTDALHWVRTTPATRLLTMSEAATTWSSAWSWADAAALTRSVYAAACSTEEQR